MLQETKIRVKKLFISRSKQTQKPIAKLSVFSFGEAITPARFRHTILMYIVIGLLGSS